MAKFNEVQKKRRSIIAQRKRAVHGDPVTGKLKQRSQPLSISGKRKRKLFKKWRREQKEAIEKGVITMEDVEMAVADATSNVDIGSNGMFLAELIDIFLMESGKVQDATKIPPVKFPMKKRSSKLKLKQLKEGKNKRKSDEQAAEASADVMME